MVQIGTYVVVQMDSQYRTHTLLVLIVGNYARLMRWYLRSVWQPTSGMMPS